MGYTISTHNGSQVSRQHNLRNEKVVSKEDHITPGGEFQTWRDVSERVAYHKLFDESVRQYNAKQTRNDRKIDNYYADVCKDARKHPVYEMIVAIGSKNNQPDKDEAKRVMNEFAKGWKERNPNLVLIGAYYHADEQGVPHVHLDYIPVAHNCSRGPKTQTALKRALGEMGFIGESAKNTAQMQWQKRENDALEMLCRTRGWEINHPKEKDAKHRETELYKVEQAIEWKQMESFGLDCDLFYARQELDEKKSKISELTKKVDALNSKAKTLYEREHEYIEQVMDKKPTFGSKKDYIKLERPIAERVMESYDILERVMELSKETRDRSRELDAREQELEKLNKSLSQDKNNASIYLEEIKAEKKKIERLRSSIEKEQSQQALKIRNEAHNRANQIMQDVLKNADFKKDYAERLRDFMRSIQLEDGNALQVFQGREADLEREVQSRFERDYDEWER